MSSEEIYILWKSLPALVRRALAENYLIQCYPLIGASEEQRLEILRNFSNYRLSEAFWKLYNDDDALFKNDAIVDYFITNEAFKKLLNCDGFRVLNFKGLSFTNEELEKLHYFVRYIKTVQKLVF